MTEPVSLSLDAAKAADVSAAAGRTFWQRVLRAFYSAAANRIAVVWVVVLLVLAVGIPFLANEYPYAVTIQGHREYPLFNTLGRVDILLLLGAAATLAYLIGHRILGKRYDTVEERRAARLKWLGLVLLVAALPAIATLLFWHDYLDTRDYRELVRQGTATHAIFAPLHWGYANSEPLEKNLVFQYPTAEHWLGTDGNGRDALARLLWSTRVVLAIGLISEVIALVIGVIYGALMGYFVGTVDILGMRFVEVVEAIPTLFLLITFVAVWGRNISMLMVIIGLTSWTGIARFVRAEFLRLRSLDYVTAAKASGIPLWSILFKHMLPNGLTPVIVTFTFGVAGAVISESILSFLGLGVQPPTPSWGSMLDEAGNPADSFRWWLALAPGMMIFLTVLAYNIIGEGLRDAIDPQLTQ